MPKRVIYVANPATILDSLRLAALKGVLLAVVHFKITGVWQKRPNMLLIVEGKQTNLFKMVYK